MIKTSPYACLSSFLFSFHTSLLATKLTHYAHCKRPQNKRLLYEDHYHEHLIDTPRISVFTKKMTSLSLQKKSLLIQPLQLQVKFINHQTGVIAS